MVIITSLGEFSMHSPVLGDNTITPIAKLFRELLVYQTWSVFTFSLSHVPTLLC